MSSINSKSPEGLRARKQRETRQRITDAGICLFLEKGYDETTIDDVAASAGISRRTFFHYFKSKDDILLSLQSGMGDKIADAVRRAHIDKRPLEAVREAVLEVCGTVPPEDMKAIDRLMRSSETIQARKQASYVEHESTLFAALIERWPDPERQSALRLVAMLAIGVIRLSTDAFSQEGTQQTMIDLMRNAFDAIQSEV
ncbi:TetR family transcriptional regulator [Sphingobium phenoxybenzoativorans]|uniref:TetR family transcriptional regulator n=1 Tax=Sphingobium phenoxybenzoativorans TaxID=1592790 RepID=A0A975K5A9_9SPHN|nr:TetR/AcrR family transcriptional regulator [Sphingobium phenoxybenzoativorans]QUT05084.1 TetR family transcriptional regulator [Sphingobium phenoxybenzoativorans]